MYLLHNSSAICSFHNHFNSEHRIKCKPPTQLLQDWPEKQKIQKSFDWIIAEVVLIIAWSIQIPPIQQQLLWVSEWVRKIENPLSTHNIWGLTPTIQQENISCTAFLQKVLLSQRVPLSKHLLKSWQLSDCPTHLRKSEQLKKAPDSWFTDSLEKF